MPRRATHDTSTPSLPSLIRAVSASRVAQEFTNSGGTSTYVAVPLTPTTRGSLGLCVSAFPTTLPESQTIPTGYTAVFFGTLTIPSGVILTVDGFLALTNVVYVS